MSILKYLIFFILILTGCTQETTTPFTSTIIVSVVDGNTPVPNANITLLPDSLVKTTNANGICKFNVSPGEYYVNAHLPGPGPTGYYYNKLVEIKNEQTITVKLKACLSCM